MTFKDDFKKGCEASGGDFVENASDDSYGCNIRTGGSINCKDDKCTYSPKFKGSGILLGLTGLGTGELISLSAGSSSGITINLTTSGVQELLDIRPEKDLA